MKKILSWIQISLTDINADLIIHSCKTTFQNSQWKEKKFWFRFTTLERRKWNKILIYKSLKTTWAKVQADAAKRCKFGLLFWINWKIWVIVFVFHSNQQLQICLTVGILQFKNALDDQIELWHIFAILGKNTVSIWNRFTYFLILKIYFLQFIVWMDTQKGRYNSFLKSTKFSLNSTYSLAAKKTIGKGDFDDLSDDDELILVCKVGDKKIISVCLFLKLIMSFSFLWLCVLFALVFFPLFYFLLFYLHFFIWSGIVWDD